MALFGLGKKKPAAPGAAAPEGIPTDRVIEMRQQGVSNDQVIQTLQQEGYSSSQIFDAMSQADIKGAVGGEGGVGEGAPPAPPGGPAPESQPMPPPEAMPPPAMPPAYAPAMPAAAPAVDKTAIEEVAESIIDEKWEELMKNVDKIIEWKELTESRIAKMEQKFKDLKERFEALHSGVLSKVSEYDKGIKGVSTDVKAMEQVFKKVLPTFTSNVNELSRLAKKMKPSSGKKK
ncbi:hypothetical protein GOV06_05115 [Candidatus Woesearchaeota archaeon]|nr:hypothetical protein [Candidatus Woesearchaeota archaeon]